MQRTGTAGGRIRIQTSARHAGTRTIVCPPARRRGGGTGHLNMTPHGRTSSITNHDIKKPRALRGDRAEQRSRLDPIAKHAFAKRERGRASSCGGCDAAEYAIPVVMHITSGRFAGGGASLLGRGWRRTGSSPAFQSCVPLPSGAHGPRGGECCARVAAASGEGRRRGRAAAAVSRGPGARGGDWRGPEGALCVRRCRGCLVVTSTAVACGARAIPDAIRPSSATGGPVPCSSARASSGRGLARRSSRSG